MRLSLVLARASILICAFGSVSQASEPRAWPVELSVGRFEIHCDFQPKAQAELVRELQSMSADIQRLLQVQQSEQPVHIVLFQTPDEYRRYMTNYFPKLPQRRALFIKDRGPGMLFTHWHKDVATDLRHEISHAVVNSQKSMLPLWLDEGLAEYFEVQAESRFHGNGYLREIAGRCKRGFVPQMSHLESVQELSQFGDSQYRDSWSWVHFMLHRSGETRQMLIRYLQVSRDGSEQLPLSRQLDQLLPHAQIEYCQHFRQMVATSLTDSKSATQVRL